MVVKYDDRKRNDDFLKEMEDLENDSSLRTLEITNEEFAQRGKDYHMDKGAKNFESRYFQEIKSDSQRFEKITKTEDVMAEYLKYQPKVRVYGKRVKRSSDI